MKNKLKLFSWLICLLIYTKITAQLKVDSIFESTSLRNIYYNDICYSFRANGSNYNIFKDSISLGLTIPRFTIKSYHYDKSNNILNLLSDGNNAKQISINFLTDIITTKEFSDLNNICIFQDQYYFFDTKTGELIKFNENDFKKESISIQQIFKKPDKYKALFVVKLNHDSTLIATGYVVDGDYNSVEYYILDDDSKLFRIIHPTDKMGSILTNSIPVLDYYSFNNDFAFCVGGILDRNYNFYANCLQKKIVIQDIVIKDNQIVQLAVLSSLDEPENKWSNNKKIVKVVVNASPEFEKLMHSIYIGEEIKEQEIKSLTTNQRLLLENMAYAKYNLKFNDNYLIAYFNLYYFYLSQRNKRLSSVKCNLTDIDKKNISILKSIND